MSCIQVGTQPPPGQYRFCNKCGQRGHTMRQCLTFKTRPCRFFYNGRCNKTSDMCIYAHGDSELRPSSMYWCTRIIYDNGRRFVEGCGNPGHTIQQCNMAQNGDWVAATPAPPPATGAQEEGEVVETE